MRTSNGKGHFLSMLGKVMMRGRPSVDSHPCELEIVMGNDLFRRLKLLSEEDAIVTTSSSHDLVRLSTLREAVMIIQESSTVAIEEDLGSSNLVKKDISNLLLDICHSINNSIAEMHSLERLLTTALWCLSNNDGYMLCSSQSSLQLQRERARKLLQNAISNMDHLMWYSKVGLKRRRSSRKVGSSCKENGWNVVMPTNGEDCVLSNLYWVACTFLGKFVTFDGYSMKKKNTLKLVELHEAHKYARHLMLLLRDDDDDDNSSYQRSEVNEKQRQREADIRWCVKQLRQHVEEMATYLKPLEKQLGSLMLNTRKNIIMPLATHLN